MKSDKLIGRIIGVLFLTTFTLGIVIYQVLQGSILFDTDYYAVIASQQLALTISIILGICSGIISITIAILLQPVLKEYSGSFGLMYLAFCILNFIAILIDSVAVASMIEYGNLQIKSDNDFDVLGLLLLRKHWWTHYLSLLISCFPVFIFFYSMFVTKLMPRFLSVFGLLAVVLMFLEILLSFFDASISMNMLFPIALAQLILPLWLIIKSFKTY